MKALKAIQGFGSVAGSEIKLNFMYMYSRVGSLLNRSRSQHEVRGRENWNYIFVRFVAGSCQAKTGKSLGMLESGRRRKVCTRECGKW